MFWDPGFDFGLSPIPAITLGTLSRSEDYFVVSERAKRLNVDVSLPPTLSPSNPEFDIAGNLIKGSHVFL